MRPCILSIFPILLEAVVSAPWALCSEQSPSHELESSLEHHGRPDRPPPPDIEGLDEPLMGTENFKTFHQKLESSLPQHDRRQATSLAGTMTTGDMTAIIEQLGSPKARQTIQAFDHLDGRHIMPIISLQSLTHNTRQPEFTSDNATRPGFNKTHYPHDPGTNSSHLPNNQRNNSLSSVVVMPPLMTDPPISFSAKPLPSDWTTITACTILRSTKSSPCTKSSNKNKNNNTTSKTTRMTSATTTTDTGAVEGCVTTVLAIPPHPCRNPKTVYTSTKTVHKSISCHGCTSLRVLSPMYDCPLITENLCERTTTAKTPYVWTSTVCEKLTALSQLTDSTTEPTSRHPKVTTATETSRHMGGATTQDTAQLTTRTEMITPTPLVWPTSMEGLPWFGVSNWHS